MPDVGYVDHSTAVPLQQPARREKSAVLRRALLLVIVTIAAAAGFVVTSSEAASQAVAQAGPDLQRLLRAMAGIKAMAAIGLVAVTYWRLAAPISAARFAVYVLACGAMAAGPGLIWGMAHLKLGALLLHGGLFIVTVALWRDPDMATRLTSEIARKRARLRA